MERRILVASEYESTFAVVRLDGVEAWTMTDEDVFGEIEKAVRHYTHGRSGREWLADRGCVTLSHLGRDVDALMYVNGWLSHAGVRIVAIDEFDHRLATRAIHLDDGLVSLDPV
jgi:hypothetical protein